MSLSDSGGHFTSLLLFCMLKDETLEKLFLISLTSTQYIDFVDFLHFTGFVYHLFYSF